MSNALRDTVLPRMVVGFGAIALLPIVVWRAIRDPRFRSSLGERVGRGGWGALFQSRAARPERALLWLHAASLGELEGVNPLMTLLRERHPDAEILLTMTSVSGKRAAEAKALAHHVLLLPLDLPILITSIVRRVDPSVMVIFETELWPNMLWALRERGVPTFVVNGRITDKTFHRYRRLRSFLRPALRAIQTYFVQSSLDRERYVEIGADRGRIQVSGSTKYDQRVPEISDLERAAYRQSLGFEEETLIFVAGSVRPGEDEIVCEAYVDARKRGVELALLIAPRHPERFAAVAQILERYGLLYHRRSHGSALGLRNEVVLLDTLGELKQAYSIAAFSFVGGTLVDIGGHNPFEPAMFGSPVIVGPYVRNIRDAVSELQRAGGLVQVKTARDLSETITRFVCDAELRERVGAGALCAWKGNLGITERILVELQRSVLNRFDSAVPRVQEVGGR